MKLTIPCGFISRALAFAAFLVLLISLSACSDGNGPISPPESDRSTGGPVADGFSTDTGGNQYAPGEVLVVLNETATQGEMLVWAADAGLLHDRTYDVPWGPLYRLRITTDEKVPEVVARLNDDPRVRFAEPNYAVTFCDAPYVPNDPLWERDDPGDDPRDNVFDQWGAAKSGAPIIWNDSKGTEETIVAVLDTGVRWTHEDLYYRVWYNMDEITGNGIDDDGNGFVDDWIGWNFDDNNNNPWDTGWSAYYHGSACSGIVAADQDNGKGLSGIAPGVKIMAVKLYLGLWPESAFVDSVVGGLHYAHDNGAAIASMSFGTTNFSEAMELACDSVYDDGNGMVLMASAGNTDTNVNHYPSGHDSVMAVAAVCAFTESHQRMPEQRISQSIGFPWGSTWGDQLEISGYGDLYTTTYGGHYDSYWDGYSDPDFFGGTSCACPMSAGVMALLKSWYPDENAGWYRERLRNTCDDLHSVGWDNQSGYGRVNAVRAICGSDRYAALEDPDGFVTLGLPESRWHDCIHDVPGNPFHDPEDLYTVIAPAGGLLTASCYIYNWGENLDMALYSDAAMTILVDESTIDNDPNHNIEQIVCSLQAGRQYYLKIYSPEPGNSSLYDFTTSVETSFSFNGYDIAPGSLPTGGDDVPFLRLESEAGQLTTIDELGLSIMGTLPLARITEVALYDDTNGSGAFDGGDVLVGSMAPGALNRLRFRDLGLEVTFADPLTLFVTVDVETAPGPSTLRLSIETYKDVVTVEGLLAAYSEFPIMSSICMVGG